MYSWGLSIAFAIALVGTAIAQATFNQATVNRLAGLWATDCQQERRIDWGHWSVEGDQVHFEYGEARATERVTSVAGNVIETVIVSATVPGVEAGQRFTFELLSRRRVQITDHARNTVEIAERCE